MTLSPADQHLLEKEAKARANEDKRKLSRPNVSRCCCCCCCCCCFRCYRTRPHVCVFCFDFLPDCQRISKPISFFREWGGRLFLAARSALLVILVQIFPNLVHTFMYTGGTAVLSLVFFAPVIGLLAVCSAGPHPPLRLARRPNRGRTGGGVGPPSCGACL